MTEQHVEQARLVWYRFGGGHFLDQTTSQGSSRTPIYANDVNEAVQTLAREGWEEIHRTGGAEGILVTLRRTTKPAPTPAPPAPSQSPAFTPRPPTPAAGAPLTRYNTDQMQPGIEYAALYWTRDGGSYSIDYYNRQSARRESGGVNDLESARRYLTDQGWTMTRATGDGEGVISYFERPAAG